ncbi:MAG TPA: esterase [Ktedonobacter sp.]|nr:esterase [Ktedonobacter sp.]
MFSSLSRRTWIIGLLLVVVLILGIVVKLFFFQYIQPPHSASASTTSYSLRTVTYCSPGNDPQLMDIYTPSSSKNTAMPLVEMVHGGGWTGGVRGGLDSIGPLPEVPAAMLGLLAAGFVVTSIDYRLAPQFKFPDNIEDVKCSIRYLRANANQYHIDPNRIGLMGASAGGHLVSLAGLAGQDAGWDIGEYTDQSSSVQAVVDMFGPEYIASGVGDPAIGNPTIFGSNPNELELATPAHYISNTPNSDPPFLIIQGDKDDTVPPYHSLRFYNDLLNANQPAVLQMVQNAGHGFLSNGPAIIPAPAQISTMIVNFFVKYLTGK